ncbi:hypothetical protein BZG35_04085 [Brevundimonas sp. LM2]|uniref:hypothetical protein n=1 Tax=Brevundimonas sp. LM2 TaxID=1938605 RepID=UPI000983A60D|nr:hypothetical protein [Brevundimonas sp. LM2]AQR60922.1 hypothetical protein BZG35_04085 [Brevundimonas sp. LM2]
MPQTVILKGQAHTFAAHTIPGNVDVITTHPATGNVRYTLANAPEVVVPMDDNKVHTFTVRVVDNTLTITNQTTSGLSCTY